MIMKPSLSPRAGYVEVEVDGVRQYMPTPDTRRRLAAELAAPTELELTQQEITDLQLNDIEQGQTITELELLILGGTGHV